MSLITILDWKTTKADFLGVAPGDVLVASDYDGTIAPIVGEPERALPLPEMVQQFSALVPLVRGVAVISGRSEQSLRRLVPLAGLIRIGENGIGAPAPDEAARIREFGHRAKSAVTRWGGVMIETKPGSISVHFRAEPQIAIELKRTLDQLIAGSGLTMVANRRVFDIQLRRAGKVRTMGRLLSELKPKAVLYAGDSRDDARVHRCLRASGIPSLCIGLVSDEMPDRVFKHADLKMDGPEGLAACLSELIRHWGGRTQDL